MRPPVRPAGVPGHGPRHQARLRPGRLRTRGQPRRPASRSGDRAGSRSRPRAAQPAGPGSRTERRAAAFARRERQAAAPRGREPRPPRRSDSRNHLPLAPRLRNGCGTGHDAGERVGGLRQNDDPRCRRPLAGGPRAEAAARERGSRRRQPACRAEPRLERGRHRHARRRPLEVEVRRAGADQRRTRRPAGAARAPSGARSGASRAARPDTLGARPDLPDPVVPSRRPRPGPDPSGVGRPRAARPARGRHARRSRPHLRARVR